MSNVVVWISHGDIEVYRDNTPDDFEYLKKDVLDYVKTCYDSNQVEKVLGCTDSESLVNWVHEYGDADDNFETFRCATEENS